MTAAPQLATSEAKEVADASWRSPFRLRCAVVAAFLWIISLAVVTWSTANPVVVNRAQIQESDFVFVGRWDAASPPRFLVERELKHGQINGPVTIQDLPEQVPSRQTPWAIPVLRHGKSYAVTQGVFLLKPVNGQPPEIDAIHVAAKVYPATDDVLLQMQSILDNSAAAKKR